MSILVSDETPVTRRQWRAVHRPAVRRSDLIFDLASWIIPIVTVGMIFWALGGRRSPHLSVDESAIAVAVSAGLIAVMSVAIVVRLLVKRGYAPVSMSGAILIAVVSGLAILIVWARSQGVITVAVGVMFAANGLSLIAGLIVLFAARARREHPEVTKAEPAD